MGYDNFNDRKLFLDSLTDDEKEQLKELETFQNTKPKGDKVFMTLNKCPHCGKPIWDN